MLERLSSEDAMLRSRQSDLEKIKAEHNVFAALQIANLGNATSLLARSFSQLIDAPSGVALMARAASTELLYTISLKGLIAFLEKGGTYNELDPADIRPFQRRIGNEAKAFQNAPLSVRYLSVSDVLRLFELHNDRPSRESFLRSCLE